jgi:hypothetical protein
MSTGGKLIYDDDQETPNTLLSSFQFPNMQEVVFEVRGLVSPEEGPLKHRGGNITGVLFYGSDGYMALDGGGYWVYHGEKREMVREGKAQRGDTGPHMDNFLKAVRSRNHEELNAELAINALASNFCHLANISHRVGRSLAWDAQKERFIRDTEADALLTRKYRAPYIVPEKV